MSNRAAMLMILGWVAIIVLVALVASCTAHATGCSNPDGCPSLAWRRYRPPTPPPLHVFKTPEEVRTAHYMLERWPVEPIYRMRGE